MMTLRYTLTPDDYIRFNLYHYDNTPSMRRSVRGVRFVMPGILVLLGLLLSGGRPVFFLFAMLLMAVFWVWFLPWYVRRVVRRGITRQVASGHYADLVGEHELTVTDTGLHRTDPAGTADYAWATLQTLGSDAHCLYLYVDTATAVIIPLSAFSGEEERRAFLDRVRAGMQSAAGETP